MNWWMKLAPTLAVSITLLTAAACPEHLDEATRTPVDEIRPGGIEDIVVDARGGPVAGMRVVIVSGTVAFPEIGPETDEDGHYRIGGVSAGTFQVAVHDRYGRRVGMGSVDVNSGATATVDLTISADATSEASAQAQYGTLTPETPGIESADTAIGYFSA